MKNRKKIFFRDMGTMLAVLLCFLASFLAFALKWLLDTWSELTVDEIVYHLTAPLTGTSGSMVKEFLLRCILPALLVSLLLISVFLVYRKRGIYGRVLGLSMLASLFTMGATFANAWDEIDLGAYIQSQLSVSDFIDSHYVDPKTVTIQFPEKKRNLIYIFLESTEITFTDTEHGGAFSEDLIPGLRQLAEDNEDFSGTEARLNGGYSMPGTTWTMGAMFAQTSGLPLKISIDTNAMDTQKSFFPSVETLGDILDQEGYNQVLMLGSVGYFGGRKLYFQTHGDYSIEDYSYWKKKGKFRSDYWVNWGFEDRKLYSYAKEELSRLSEEGEPFNLTLLTVDTHFPNGYRCAICPTDHEDNQYADVYECASRQLTEFLRWARQQDWYENTTIVISGDHPTMDHNFCRDVPDSYTRKVYTAYINAAAENHSTGYRDYTTFDNFPTTLAAMGVTIPGDRLGLGTNLFSGTKTLSEEYGREYEKTELEKKSLLMQQLGQIDRAAAYESKAAKLQAEKEKKEKAQQTKG